MYHLNILNTTNKMNAIITSKNQYAEAMKKASQIRKEKGFNKSDSLQMAWKLVKFIKRGVCVIRKISDNSIRVVNAKHLNNPQIAYEFTGEATKKAADYMKFVDMEKMPLFDNNPKKCVISFYAHQILPDVEAKQYIEV